MRVIRPSATTRLTAVLSSPARSIRPAGAPFSDVFVARIERRLAERADQGERALQRKREHQKEMVLGSMAISVPLLAIAAIFTGVQGVIVVCVALAVIAVVSSRS
jgi:hypothetical protein